jgi:sterol desaturase/sphingolipid hydroxylase (fatty acid hydroxylase superfamily)
MTIDAFLRNTAALLAVMALLSLFESLLPFARKQAWRRRHWIPNLALLALTLALYFAFNAGAVLVSAWLGLHRFGLLSGVPLPPLALVGIGIVVLDASTYTCHRLMHRLPPLWRAHRVHHSDPLVDVTTALRQHPLEGLWRSLFVMAPAWALGVPAGAVAIYRVASAMQGLAEHVNVRLWEPLDRALSFVTCTPNMHKLHHSRRAIETDSNYGNLLSLFDRVFGTFMPPTPGRCVDYGLDGYDAPEAQQLGALLRLPFRRAEQILSPVRAGEPGGQNLLKDATS